MIIRDAAPEDWPRIWPFFHEIVAAADTFAYPPDLTYEQSRDLWMLEAPKRTTVAVDDAGAILGSATMYANRGGNGDHVASASYMVDPARSGRGVGRALVEDSLRWARAQGFRGFDRLHPSTGGRRWAGGAGAARPRGPREAPHRCRGCRR
jgi:GNAT superfamily N-acetyltransferase